MKKPSWWNHQHEGTWDRVKHAMKRDWEQTKHDFGSDTAPDLDQSVGDTVKQMAGKEDVDTRWDDLEPAYRYGVGARAYYGDDWAKTESRMSNEWSELDDDRAWDDVKGQVRRAYEYGERTK